MREEEREKGLGYKKRERLKGGKVREKKGMKEHRVTGGYMGVTLKQPDKKGQKEKAGGQMRVNTWGVDQWGNGG